MEEGEEKEGKESNAHSHMSMYVILSGKAIQSPVGMQWHEYFRGKCSSIRKIYYLGEQHGLP